MSEIAKALKAARKPKKTQLQHWIDGLDDEDRAALESARTDPELSAAAITRVMVDAGYSPAKDTVSKWRRG